MKCRILFSRKNKKNISICHLSRVISVNRQAGHDLNSIDWKVKLKQTINVPASVTQLDAPSDWRPGGHGFNPRRGRQDSFLEVDHEIFSSVILSLPLIQEGQL